MHPAHVTRVYEFHCFVLVLLPGASQPVSVFVGKKLKRAINPYPGMSVTVDIEKQERKGYVARKVCSDSGRGDHVFTGIVDSIGKSSGVIKAGPFQYAFRLIDGMQGLTEGAACSAVPGWYKGRLVAYNVRPLYFVMRIPLAMLNAHADTDVVPVVKRSLAQLAVFPQHVTIAQCTAHLSFQEEKDAVHLSKLLQEYARIHYSSVALV